jgi:cell division protein ZapA
MPQVSITLNGRSYAVACDTGEEERIGDLARYLDGKITVFASQFPHIGEARLLVLAALVVTDELAEAREALRRRSVRAPGPADGTVQDEAALAAGIENLATRIEAVAARLEITQI